MNGLNWTDGRADLARLQYFKRAINRVKAKSIKGFRHVLDCHARRIVILLGCRKKASQEI